MPAPEPQPARLALCVDFGSTFTKALLIDLDDARLLASAEHRTTLPDAAGDGDVLDGYEACRAEIAATEPRVAEAEVLACSSAGGGLRIAVVGNEELVTAEAGRRVALSSGGTVVAVVAAASPGAISALERTLADARPDVVLLTGGTDGGNGEVLLTAARALVGAGWRGPVVVAGNIDAQPEVARLLADDGVPHVLADNVVPRIGVLAPDGARAAVREVFLSHVIGGKHLSRGDVFERLVLGATPDVVLTGVEVLAEVVGDVVVVDVGGATTDVHSVVELDPEDAALARDVVAPTRLARTVEGDLGMRWSAATLVEAAALPDLDDAARRRVADPALLPTTDAERDEDERLAAAAVGVALRRHAGRARVVLGSDGRVVERTGRDLREVAVVVGSGGALRHGRPGHAGRLLDAASADGLAEGWQLPERARAGVDADYLLVAVGLLAARHPAAAKRLAGVLASTLAG